MTTNRFSTQNVMNALHVQIHRLESIWGFDPDNGTNQIEDKTDFDRAVAYGEYSALCDLYYEIQNRTLLG